MAQKKQQKSADDAGIHESLRKILNVMEESGRGCTVQQISEKTKLSMQTVYREMDFLKEYKLVQVSKAGRNNVYSRIPNVFMQPADLTFQETFAIGIFGMDFMKNNRIPLFRPIYNAYMKLCDRLPSDQLEKINTYLRLLRTTFAPLANMRGVGNASFPEKLLEACVEQQPVRIVYESFSDNQIIETVLHPYVLTFHRRAWYGIGWSTLHNEERTFHMDRIQTLEVLKDVTFILPPYGWSLEEYLGNAWSLIRGPKDYNIRIRFSKMVAKNVQAVNWHKTQEFVEGNDGTTEMRVTVSGLHEISWWVLGYGKQAEVLEPLEFRDIVKEEVMKMAKMYG